MLKKFYLKQKVKIIGGFYKGNSGIIMQESSDLFFKKYRVYFEFEWGLNWTIDTWIPAKHIDAIDAPKVLKLIRNQNKEQKNYN